MSSPYTPVTVTNYNLNPPADDGSQVPSNKVLWSNHKTKIGDPLKTAIEAVDANLTTAFGKVAGGITSVNDNYQVLSTDQGKLVVQTVAAKTVTTPDATSVGTPFKFSVLNNSTGDMTLDGSGSQTIDGLANITVPPQSGIDLDTDGSNWFTKGEAKPREFFTVAVSDETTAITTGTAKVTFRMPYAFTLTQLPRASLSTASSSGAPAVDVNEGGVSIFSTTLTIDANEKTSTTAATPAVLSDTTLADDAEMTIDIDTAGTGAKGLKVTFIGHRA